MANIVVGGVMDASGFPCLQIMDLNEYTGDPFESGVALRRVVRRGDQITWYYPNTATSFAITFAAGGNGPFTAAPAAGAPTGSMNSVVATVSGAAARGRYKYTITLKSGGTTFEEDPQIVIDTGAIGVNLTRKPVKKASKTVKRK